MRGFNIERITPRTCLWPLVLCLCCSFALSIGLTYRSNHHCYAGTCGETLFPTQARLHIVIWYLWISLSVVFLGLQAFQTHVRIFVSRLSTRYVSIGRKRLALTACFVALWILILYGVAIAIWWSRLAQYFYQQGQSLPGNGLVAGVALTGHLADITMGMVLLPVSRHSAIVSLFKISSNSTYTFHKTQAYVLFSLVLVHGLLYGAWAALYNEDSDRFRYLLPLFNPTYLYSEVWPGNLSSLGIWRASLIFTGSLSGLIMLIIFATSLPYVRHFHFNVFYFTHFLTIVAVVVICLHASTMFYCTLPGIMMWLLDWGMRVYELRKRVDGRLTTLGNGWFSLEVFLPRNRISGCACDSPLAHFYVHHSRSSIRELHPFTTITYLRAQKEVSSKTNHIAVEFLFRQSQPVTACAKMTLVKSNQWTNRLGGLIDEERSVRGSISNELSPEAIMGTNIKVRLEGPYFKTMNSEARNIVICLVGGTGLSGAIAIGKAFQEHSLRYKTAEKDSMSPVPAMDPTENPWTRCVIIWLVREDAYTHISSLEALQAHNLEIRIHKTGSGRPRPKIEQSLREVCGHSGHNAWAYISGPDGFVKATELACQRIKDLTWSTA